jgi:hypothetical protein
MSASVAICRAQGAIARCASVTNAVSKVAPTFRAMRAIQTSQKDQIQTRSFGSTRIAAKRAVNVAAMAASDGGLKIDLRGASFCFLTKCCKFSLLD